MDDLGVRVEVMHSKRGIRWVDELKVFEDI
jgi:hypothetical protein